MAKKNFLLIILLLLTLFLTLIPSCGNSDDEKKKTEIPQSTSTLSAETQNLSETAESVCDITSDRVGEQIAVTGRLGMIDRDNPEGIYAGINEGLCQAGIWITKEQWQSWTEDEQSLLQTGSQIVAKGRLNSFEGNLILELNTPLGVATENVSKGSEAASEDVLAAVAERLNLVAVSEAGKRLNVEKVYSGGEGPGFCYLGAYAMLARYADSSIGFSDVIASSGVGASALYLEEINLLMNGFEIGSIANAAQNQGFSYYISALEGASLTDEFLARNLVENAESILSVTTDEEEAFELLKRLISSDIPVVAHLDINYVRDDLIAYCPYWEMIFNWQDRNMSSTHIDHYMSVNGYDQDFVYLNDPTEKQDGLGQDIPIKIESFLDAWENGNHPSFGEESRIGPYWMLFLGDRTDPMGSDELLSWNKDIGAKAIPEIKKAAVNPNVSELMHSNEMARSRAEFATFLAENGYTQASEYFTQMSDLFAGLMWSSDQKADILQIADLQELALAALSSEAAHTLVSEESDLTPPVSPTPEADVPIVENPTEESLPEEDLGEGNGSDVLTIGDSWMAVDSDGIEPSLNLAAGKTYVNQALGGALMLNATRSIPGQYEAVRSPGKFKTVVMTGGGNDILMNGLVTDCAAGGMQCVLQLLAVAGELKALWEEMNADGVMDVIYVLYSSDAMGGIGNLFASVQLRALSESVTPPLRCHLFYTDEYVLGDLIPDGIHPTPEACGRIGQGIYDLMVAEGMRR